jgi:multiple sugar transport system substrate-binding protein
MAAQIRLKGLTWDHRRAIDPMTEATVALKRDRPDIEIAWDVQPLSGFEFRPIEDIVASYDLLVFDHPHVGHAAEAGLLRPLDHLVPNDVFIGPSLATYRWADTLWAVPVDAACQTACYRPDLLPDGAPRTWSDMMALARRQRLGAALNGVHAFMTFLTLAANLGDPCAQTPDLPLVRRDTATRVLVAMRDLAAACPPEALDWNSIALQDAMCARDDLAYCPLVYGFATYAEADRSPRLAFADIPDFGGKGPLGSTIGGAGLGISARTSFPEAAEAFAAFVARSDTQCAIIAGHHGQPAHRDAWHDRDIDIHFGGFFSSTRATIENSSIRPRFPGYMAVQRMAGPLIENHLRGGHDEATVLAGLGIA